MGRWATRIAGSIIKNISTLHSSRSINWTWWLRPVILALGRWRQEDEEFKIIYSYIMSLKLA